MAETFDYITVTTPDGSVQYKAPPMASEFSASASYAAGDYCTYQGLLYRFSADHAAGAWTGTDATAVSLAGDVSDLKGDFNTLCSLDSFNLLSGASWELGFVNVTTGVDSWSETRIRTDYISIPADATKIAMSCDSGWKFYAVIINDDKTQVTATQNWSISAKEFDLRSLASGNRGYFRMMLQRTDNTINIADYVHAHSGYYSKLITDVKDCISGVDLVSKSDIRMYFAFGAIPSISDISIAAITVSLSDKNMIIYDGISERDFTPSDILSAASTFGLTTDSEARTFTGSVFALVYNYKTRAISFVDPYTKIGAFEINLLTRIASSNISGLIWDEIITNKVSQSEKDVDALESVVYPQVPSYYETQLATVKASVESDLQTVGGHGDNFVFITDIHWSGNFKHSPGLIKSLAQGKMVNLIVNGGDLIDGTTDKAAELARQIACVDAFNEAEIPMITAKGNHDLNSGYGTSANYFTENEYFATAQHRNALEGMVYGGDCYFYWDKVSTNTRYIILDSGATNIGDGIGISAYQVSWIQTVIENTPADYHIIVVVHALGAYQSTTNPVGDSNQFVYYTGTQDLLDALDDLLPSHMIEAVFFGHTHYDANYTTEGGIPLISTNSDARHQYYGMPEPSDGTVNSQCFDVVTVDYSAKKIYMRRVGRGSDRVITYGA